MSDSSKTTTPMSTSSGAQNQSLGDVIEFVKSYAKQETMGPLKGAGSWLAFGAAGAFALGLGLFLVLLGVLRLVQTEVDRTASGALSWLAYLITFLVTVVLLVFTVSRITKNYLNNEAK